MRSLLAPLAIGLGILAISCSKPDERTAEDSDSESASEKATPRSFADLDPAISGEEPIAETFPEPSLEPTGPVHESPGIVDNREAQVAFDLLKMEQGSAKSLALTELFDRWAEEDLNAAMEFFPYVVKDVENKRAFLRGVAPQLLEQDPERLVEITKEHWWQGQFEAYVEGMKKVADSNLDMAIDVYTEKVEGRQYPWLAEKIAVNVLEERSFEEAEAFALSVERPEARGMAFEGIVNRWTKENPVAAATYVDNISDPLIKDYAIRGLIRRAAGWSPEETLVWTMTIREGDVRMGAVKQLANRWSKLGKQEYVGKLLEQPGLTDKEREAIRKSAGE